MKKVSEAELRELVKAGEDLTNVDVFEVTDMSNLFSKYPVIGDISTWVNRL